MPVDDLVVGAPVEGSPGTLLKQLLPTFAVKNRDDLKEALHHHPDDWVADGELRDECLSQGYTWDLHQACGQRILAKCRLQRLVAAAQGAQ